MARVAITGSSGFIGTNLVQRCLDNRDTVVGFDVVPPRNAAHMEIFRHLDCLDRGTLRGALEDLKPDYIFHLAARTDLGGTTVQEYAINSGGTENLCIVSCAIPTLKRIVFVSSMLVCKPGYRPSGDEDYCPTTAYGESKVLAEEAIRSSKALKCEWVIARPTHIWGPWFGAPYLQFFSAIQRGLYLHPIDVTIRKSFGFVGNAAFQLDRMARSEGNINARTIYVSDYEPLDVGLWADAIADAMKVRRPRRVPLTFLRALAVAGDALKWTGLGHPPLTSFRLSNMLTETSFDLTATQEICGEVPYTVEQGIRCTLAWMSEMRRQ